MPASLIDKGNELRAYASDIVNTPTKEGREGESWVGKKQNGGVFMCLML